jgi:ABC-type antimicrobial peptide transport system permease subunit
MDLNVWLFIIPLLITLVLTGVTIGILVARAARQNPVDNLRYE